MNTDVNLYVERDALLRQLLEVDDISVIKKVQSALKRALSTVKETAAQKEEEEVERAGGNVARCVYGDVPGTEGRNKT